MATYETAMLEDTMFEHPDNIEMAVDPETYVNHSEDIDIDLDFADHAQQDEMMIEDNGEMTHDLELGDAVIDQDAEMTDESAEDELLDEEIIDAPPEHALAQVYHSNGVSALRPVEDQKENDTTLQTHEEVSLQPQVDALDKTAAEVQEEIVEPDTTVEHAPETLNNEETSIPTTKAPVEEEVEELITWESDDEEEGDDKDKVGENATTNDGVTTETSIEPSEDISTAPEQVEDVPGRSEEITTNLGEHIAAEKSPVIEDAAKGDAQEQEELAETITYEDDDEDEDAVRAEALGETKPPVGVQPTQIHTDEHNTANEARPGSVHEHDTAVEDIEQSALDQLHPIVVRYMEQEMSLFPPTVEEEHTVFFLSQKKLAFDTCSNLFKAFRDVLGDSITENESLVLGCPGLGLEIGEGIPESSTLSIAQLLHLHLGLSHNDGIDQPTPLILVLKHQYDVSARLNELYALMGDGKGLSALSNDQSSDSVDDFGAVADNDDTEHLEDNATSKAETDVKQNDERLEVPDDGFATPKHRSQLEVLDDEPDFSSPAAVQKPSDMVNKLDESEDRGNHPVAVQETSDEITYDEEDEIGYDDVDEEEGNTGHQSDVDVAASVFDPASTNHETNEETSLEDGANDRAEAGTHHLLDSQAQPDEDQLDFTQPKDQISDNKEESHDNLASYTDPAAQTNGNTTAQDPTTSNSTVPEIPPPDDDTFDEIGYSDDEESADEHVATNDVSQLADTSSLKPSSPKRSIDQVDGVERDSKRLKAS